MLDHILRELNETYQDMVETRRDFHENPELSFQEVRTAKKIREYHQSLGLEVRTEVGGGGVVATLRGRYPGKTVAVRADFDALPLHEQTGAVYQSKIDGVMHACGHDAHTAIALGLAKVFSKYRNELFGNIVFIHQHAEEKEPGGAKSMVADNCLEGVDAIFATHMENGLPVGQIAYRSGYIMASSDNFYIEVRGVGGHASTPHETTDPLLSAAQLVVNLQQVVSRNVDPLKSAVLSVGVLKSGDAPNIISESAIIQGTVRTFNDDVRTNVEDMIREITEHTCKLNGNTYTYTYNRGFPSTWNHPMETDLVCRAAESIIGKENVIEMEPQMGADDFSYYLKEIPGAYFFTGSANSEDHPVYPYHHPKFDIDERAMLIAAKTLASTMMNYVSIAAASEN